MENENIDLHTKLDEVQQEVFHLLKLNRDVDAQYEREQKDKQTLTEALNRFESNLDEMTKQAEVLAQEKQNLEILYEQVGHLFV